MKLLAILFIIAFVSGCSREKIIYNKETSEFELINDTPPIVVNNELETNPFMDEWVTYNKNRLKLLREINKDNYEKY